METQKFKTMNRWPLVFFLILSFAMLSSCVKEVYNRYGFDSDFEKNSSGLTMMSIGSKVASIRLSGNVYMDSGQLSVEFIDPDGYIVYTQNFFSPGSYYITETFKASHGIWRLRYTSLEGCGSIDLHADF
jgi:hypothetical protein